MTTPTLLTIITPCARRWLLPSVAATIQRIAIPPGIQLRWEVDFHNPFLERSEVDFRLRLDRMIDELPSGYWLYIADDQTVSPDILTLWSTSTRPAIWMFHMQCPEETLYVNERSLMNGEPSDNGQAIISVELFRSLHITYHQWGWERYTFRHIAKERGFEICPKILAFHQDLKSRYP